MPTWLKIVLVLLVGGILLLVTAGVLVAKFIKNESREAERAAAVGKGIGFTTDLAGCVKEGVHHIGSCDGSKLTCGLRTHSFMWGCMDTAGYDAAYCKTVAPIENTEAARKWAEYACALHGQRDDEICSFTLTVVSSFCSSRGNTG